MLSLEISQLNCKFDDQKVIFEQADSKGDDFGDGSYVYPELDGYSNGMCDIMTFRIAENSMKVYFKLNFQKGTNPNERTVTSIILLSCSDSISIQSVEFNSNIKVSEKIDYFIMITGSFVCVRDFLGEKVLMCDLRWSNCNLVDADSVYFSLPKEILNKNINKINVFIGFQKGKDVDSRYGSSIFRDIEVKENLVQKRQGIIPNVYDILEPEGRVQSKILDISNDEVVVLPLLNVK